MSQPMKPTERRSDWWCCRADYPGHETTCENFEERRTGTHERRGEDRGFGERAAYRDNPNVWTFVYRTGPADRRSPGGAGLDSAVGGEGGGSAAVRPYGYDRCEVCGAVATIWWSEGPVFEAKASDMHPRCGFCPYEPDDDESVRCTCEWCHPMDGSVDALWPAELDPRCAVHAGHPGPASAPPHEQQNEPSSSPARAPGDEPAEPLGWAVLLHREDGCSGGVFPSRAEAEAQAATYRVQYPNCRYTVEPVGGAEREPRTSEARTPEEMAAWREEHLYGHR